MKPRKGTMSISMQKGAAKTVVVLIAAAAVAAAAVFAAYLFLRGGAGSGGAGSAAGSSGASGPAAAAGPGANAGAAATALEPVSAAFPNAPTGSAITIGTPQGMVAVNNFYLTSPGVAGEGNVMIAMADNYDISYDPASGNFSLLIKGSPFSAARAAAERAFLGALGISEADACKLSVQEGVPYRAGDPRDGQSYPLDFCPPPAGSSNGNIVQ